MVSHHALAALLFCGAANAAVARAVSATTTADSATTTLFWTATDRYVASVSTEFDTYRGSTQTYRETYWRTAKPNIIPTATPASAYTSSYSVANVLIIDEYYSNGAVAESDLLPDTLYNSGTGTETPTPTYSSIAFSMPVVMTAPASCPTAFTVSTTVSVSVPSMVWNQLKPASTISSSQSTAYYGTYIYEYQTWLLTENAAPFTSTNDLTYSYYIASCTPPPASYTGSGNYGGGYDDGSSSRGSRNSWHDYQACYFGGCTSVMTWIIIIATILPALFLLGFFESYFWFRRLMMGKSAMRFGTVSWVLLSLWVLCFLRMQDARSKEDQKVLTEKWRAVPMGQALKLWLRWGFKHRYPVPLLGQFSKQTVGIVPEGQPLHPALMQQPGFAPGAPPPAQMGQVYYYPAPQNGQAPMPPQQTGYYAGEMAKGSPTVSTSSVVPPQAPQAAYHPPTSPPPSGQLPTPPPQAQAPPANVNEAPGSQAPRGPPAA